jgi:hypothetical protein
LRVEAFAGLLEAVALDETHGVEAAAVVVASQAMGRHDTGKLRFACHLRFQQEARPAVVVVGVLLLDLLESHLAL